MFNKIRMWLHKHFFIKKYKVEPKGLCLLNYIIKVYFNKEYDYNESYEKMIDKRFEDGPNKDAGRFFCIIRLALCLFMILPKEDKDKYLSLIKDKELYDMIRENIYET